MSWRNCSHPRGQWVGGDHRRSAGGALPDSIVLRGGTDRIITISDPAAGKLGVTFSAGTPKDWSTGDLARLAELAARGDLITTVAGTYPLERAADAQRVSETGHVRGKLVLTP